MAKPAAPDFHQIESLGEDIKRYVLSILGNDLYPPDPFRYYSGLAYAIRERLIKMWLATQSASAVLALLMASGVTTDENPAYVFAGFAPPKTQARLKWLEKWCAGEAPVVMYEAPHRLRACLRDLLAENGVEFQDHPDRLVVGPQFACGNLIEFVAANA